MHAGMLPSPKSIQHEKTNVTYAELNFVHMVEANLHTSNPSIYFNQQLWKPRAIPNLSLKCPIRCCNPGLHAAISNLYLKCPNHWCDLQFLSPIPEWFLRSSPCLWNPPLLAKIPNYFLWSPITCRVPPLIHLITYFLLKSTHHCCNPKWLGAIPKRFMKFLYEISESIHAT